MTKATKRTLKRLAPFFHAPFERPITGTGVRVRKAQREIETLLGDKALQPRRRS